MTRLLATASLLTLVAGIFAAVTPQTSSGPVMGNPLQQRGGAGPEDDPVLTPLTRGTASPRAARSRATSPVHERAATPRPRRHAEGRQAERRTIRRAGRGLHWDRLAQCESGGNPRAVNPSGKYRGAYQMDASFWRTYGGLAFASRPELASLAEQTVVAARGYAARGSSPWPECGWRLR